MGLVLRKTNKIVGNRIFSANCYENRLVKSIKVLKTPLSDAKGLVDKKILNSETVLCQSSMDAMKADLKAVDKKIKELINQDPVLKELFDIAECRPVVCSKHTP